MYVCTYVRMYVCTFVCLPVTKSTLGLHKEAKLFFVIERAHCNVS